MTAGTFDPGRHTPERWNPNCSRTFRETSGSSSVGFFVSGVMEAGLGHGPEAAVLEGD